MRGCEVVFHRAGLPPVPRSLQDPLTSNDTNVIATLNVLLAARDEGVQCVVYASSSSVDGGNPDLPKREDMAPLPISPYATVKLASEGYCRSFGPAYGLKTIALRYSNVFSPRQDPNSQCSAVVPNFITALFARRTVTIYGDGHQLRDLTYVVANVVQANVLAMDEDYVSAQVHNIACGNQVTLNQLFGELQALLGTENRAVYRPRRGRRQAHSLADISRARNDLATSLTSSCGKG